MRKEVMEKLGGNSMKLILIYIMIAKKAIFDTFYN